MTLNTIILNSSHVVANSSNTKYTFTFTSPTTFTNAKIALSNLQMYYSWFNVSDLNNNRLFYYKWIDGTVIEVKLNEGSYSIDTINLFLEQIMINNGHYLYDTVNKVNVFYMNFRSNITYYTFELNTLPVPVSLPTGYTKPAPWVLPISTRCPQITIISSNNFKTLVGFPGGDYPPTQQPTSYTLYAGNTPVISPVSSLIMRCNLIKNKLSNPVNDVIYSFSTGATVFADNINERPNNLIYQTIADGTYRDITITFFDQNYNSMKINDSQILITLVIENPDE